jgi:hypothetical protein
MGRCDIEQACRARLVVAMSGRFAASDMRRNVAWKWRVEIVRPTRGNVEWARRILACKRRSFAWAQRIVA